MIRCRNNHITSTIARIYLLICIVYVVSESVLLLYISFSDNTRAIVNSQPAGMEWHILSYILVACMVLASIIYIYESAKHIFANAVLNTKNQRYTMPILILKITSIFISEVIITIIPFIISQI